jgi:hypothetical protein
MISHISDVIERRGLAQIFDASKLYPDPYESPPLFHATCSKARSSLLAPSMPGGTKWCVLNSVLIFVLYSIQNPYRERNIPARLRSHFGVTFPTIDVTAYNCSYIRSHSCGTSLKLYLLQHPMRTIVSNTNYPAPHCTK